MNTCVIFGPHELLQYAYLFKLPFWEKLFSQIIHLYNFLYSWTARICFFKYPCCEIFYPHVLLEYASSNFFVLRNFFHKPYTSLTFCLQELLEYAPSNFLDVRSLLHKVSTCVISCPHELLNTICSFKFPLCEKFVSQSKHLCTVRAP